MYSDVGMSCTMGNSNAYAARNCRCEHGIRVKQVPRDAERGKPVKALRQYLLPRCLEMVEDLGLMVNMETPSGNKEALDQFCLYLAGRFSGERAETTVIPMKESANALRVEWGMGPGRVLVLCHMDTVWPMGEIQKRPFRLEAGKAYGPGALDMKGGIVVALYALRALNKVCLSPCRQAVILFTPDEEVGGDASRALIDAEARHCDFVLVLEPGTPPRGALKTWRKGVGRFTIEIDGRASHAGADPRHGVSAIEELCHQVLRLHSMTGCQPGVTVNVGIVDGGTRSNVVAAKARAEVDVRVVTVEQGRSLTQEILNLKPANPASRIRVSGGMNWPPMERTEGTVALYRKACAIAQEMGFEVSEEGSGGCSDGNITAAMGIPTLDGLGAVGDGCHSTSEHVVVGKLPERAALLAGMLVSD